MKDNKGFVISLFLIGLPLFISCLMVFTSLLFCIRNHDLAQSICFKYNLQAQEQIKSSLQALLLMNPVAKKLGQLERHLRKRLATVKDPLMAAALKAKIDIIRQKRVFLDKKQKYILNQTNKYVESSFIAFKRQIMRWHTSHIKKEHYSPIALAVKAQSKRVVAPAYYPVQNFSKHQKVSFSWKMPLYQFLPR